MAYTIIASITVSSPTATVTFSSIPATYRDLAIRASARNADTGSVFMNMRLNGDTSSSYQQQWLTYNGTTLSRNGLTVDAIQGRANGASNTANYFGAYEAYITNYTSSTQIKAIGVSSHAEDNSTSTNVPKLAAAANWTTSAITSISFYNSGSANFATGTTLYLYGIS